MKDVSQVSNPIKIMSRNLFNKSETSKLIILIISLLICSTDIQAQYQLRFDAYRIYSVEKDSLIAQYLRDVILENQPFLSDFFELKLVDEVNIYLPRSDAHYSELSKRNIPDWSGAVALITARKIILRPGNYFDPQEYRETLLHELVHIYTAEKVGDKVIPLWFNEGLAMNLSGKSISWSESITIANTIASGYFISLNQIDSLLNFGYLKANVAYLEAFLAVQYLIENYGLECLKYILRDINEGESIDNSFKKNTSLDLLDFEFEFYHQVKKKYRWMVLLQFENLMWVGLIVLVFMGFVIIKIRNRRLMKSWQNDEEI
jgi:hypothetical protein